MLKTKALQFRGIQSWIKSVLLIEDVPERPEQKPDENTPAIYYTILDLCCNDGVDLSKIQQYSYKHNYFKKYYVGLDTSQSSVDAAMKKWSDKSKPFAADFYCIDLDQESNPKWTNLSPSKVQNKGKFTSVICLNEFEKFFANETCIHSMLQFVSNNLKDGGFFFGLCMDSSHIFLQSIDKGQLETTKIEEREIKYMSIKRDMFELQLFKNFEKIGTPFSIRIKGEETSTSSKPKQIPKQYLVHFPTLIQIAKQYQLQCLHITNCVQFFEDYKEFYASDLDAYSVFKDKQDRTVDAAQVELLEYYTTFAFCKLSDIDPITKTQRDLRKHNLTV